MVKYYLSSEIILPFISEVNSVFNVKSTAIQLKWQKEL